MDVTFVIPALNEAKSLPGTLARLDAFLEGCDIGQRRVVVVDDGSTDGTAGAVEALGNDAVTVIRHPRNMGKGAAVRTGVLEGVAPSRAGDGADGGAKDSGHVVVVTDADGNYLRNPAAPYLRAIRDGADIVLASRAHGRSTWRVSRDSCRYIHRRRAMGSIFCELTRRLLGADMGDTQTGLKFFRARVAVELFGELVIPGFAYDVEIMYRALRRGLVVRELPLVYCCPTSESRVGFWAPAWMAYDILRVRRMLRSEGRPG